MEFLFRSDELHSTVVERDTTTFGIMVVECEHPWATITIPSRLHLKQEHGISRRVRSTVWIQSIVTPAYVCTWAHSKVSWVTRDLPAGLDSTLPYHRTTFRGKDTHIQGRVLHPHVPASGRSRTGICDPLTKRRGHLRSQLGNSTCHHLPGATSRCLSKNSWL